MGGSNICWEGHRSTGAKWRRCALLPAFRCKFSRYSSFCWSSSAPQVNSVRFWGWQAPASLWRKDFIVGFLGWFVLMGKNGIRLGDWVEINGVTGEVVELGMFHTVLLETGNWTDSGHPTGRRVTFTNSFAIEGHYFNFSTSGQWLLDELQIVLP